MLNGTKTVAAVAGLATFAGITITGPLLLPLGAAGPGYTLRVSSGSLTAAVSAPFDVT